MLQMGSKPCIRYSLSPKSLDYNLAGTYRLPTRRQHHNITAEKHQHHIASTATSQHASASVHITSHQHHITNSQQPGWAQGKGPQPTPGSEQAA